MFKFYDFFKVSEINIKTLFFPLFAAFSVFVFLWFNNYSLELFNFNGRVLGISTFDKIDVKLRISQFYKAIFYSLITFVVLLITTNALYKSKRKIRTEFLLINYISIIGIFVLVFFIFGQNVKFSLVFISSLIFTLIILSIIKLIVPKYFIYTDYFFYLWSSMISFSFAVLLSFFVNSFSAKEFLISFNILNLTILLISTLKTLKLDFNKLYKTFSIWISLPFFIFLSQELYLIFNQRGLQIVKPEIILLLIVIILLFITISYFFKNKNVEVFKNIKKTKKSIVTAFIISILFITYYTPFGNEPNEMFEAANISNSIMNFFHFNRFPVLEFLPTHLVQDLSYGYLYTFLNGYQANFSYEAYRFLFIVLTGLVFYFFIAKITNRYLALIFILFFPFISTITWGVKGALFLLVPIIVFELYKETNFKNFILFFLVLLIEVSWSPDSGSASLIIMLTALMIIGVLNYKKGILKKAFLAFLLVFLPVLIAVFIVGLIKDINVIENIKTALEFYSSSPQARGYSEIARKYDSLFIFHHIIFPFVILLISVILIFKIKTLYKRHSFAVIAILSLSFFYLLNFQRGLTRHSFYEGNDSILSSVLFLIFGLIVYMLNIKSKILKHSLFIIILTLLILSFKLKQALNNENVISSLEHKIENLNQVEESDTLIKRVIFKNDSYYLKNDSLINFFKTNLKEESTYFDFSNQPLLYYLTQNKGPVYFLHFLAVTNDNLQEKMIQELKIYDIPFVIFSSYPTTWWDKTDGIDNSVRYYKVAEFIYRNYKPYSIINNHFIWKRIDFEIINDSYNQQNIPVSNNFVKLKKLPFVWANYDDKIKGAELIQELKKQEDENNIFNFDFSENFDKSSGNFLEFSLKRINKKADKCTVEILSDSISHGKFVFDVLNENSEEKYILRPSNQYYWYSKPVNKIKITFKESNSVVEKVKLLKGN